MHGEVAISMPSLRLVVVVTSSAQQLRRKLYSLCGIRCLKTDEGGAVARVNIVAGIHGFAMSCWASVPLLTRKSVHWFPCSSSIVIHFWRNKDSVFNGSFSVPVQALGIEICICCMPMRCTLCNM